MQRGVLLVVIVVIFSELVNGCVALSRQHSLGSLEYRRQVRVPTLYPDFPLFASSDPNSVQIVNVIVTGVGGATGRAGRATAAGPDNIMVPYSDPEVLVIMRLNSSMLWS